MQAIFLPLFSVILLFVSAVGSKHKIFKGANFGTFRNQSVVNEKGGGIFGVCY